MKSIYFPLLLVIIGVPATANAQDWQCVYQNMTSTFSDTAKITVSHPINTMWVVNIDSVKVIQGWNYHFGYRKPRLISETPFSGTYGMEYCFDPFGPSRMGVAMSALGGENFFFNSSGDGIRFSTLMPTNQPWICCRITDTTRLDAMVASTGIETVLGVADSVKYISFQAKRITGELISHPINNQVFKLSKHFGMLTLFDFYVFPNYPSGSEVHLLTGISSQGQVSGEQNLSYKEVFSFSPGDEFHTDYGGSDPHYSPPMNKVVKRVLESKLNSTLDTVTYKMSLFYHSFNGQPDGKHIYGRDTIIETYSILSDKCNGVDNFPEQTIFCFNTNGTLKSVNSYNQFRNSRYNSRRVKEEKENYVPCSFCADTLVGISKTQLEDGNWLQYYIDGCGGPFYYYSYTNWYHDTQTTFFNLVYFKKGNETWGTPLDTTDWVVPQILQEQEKVPISIYPNPSGDMVTVEIPIKEKTAYWLEIITLTGNKIIGMEIFDSKSTFDISSFGKGMYILKLFDENLQVGQQKLIKK